MTKKDKTKKPGRDLNDVLMGDDGAEGVLQAFEDGLEDVEAAAAPPETAGPDSSTANSGGVGRNPENPAPHDQPQGSAPPHDPAPPDQPPGATPPQDPFYMAAGQPLNDYGNGQRLVIHFGENLMFVPRVGWFTWSGKVWERDPDQLAVRRNAQAMAALIERETDYVIPSKREYALIQELKEAKAREAEIDKIPAADRDDDDRAELSQIQVRKRQIDGALKGYSTAIGRVLTHAKNAGNNGPLEHMVTQAETDLARAVEQLDADPLAINTQSGVLRFRQTDMREDGAGVQVDYDLHPHRRDDLLTNIVQANFDPKARSTRFKPFLDRVMPDPEMQAFLQRYFGLALTGEKSRCFLFFYGHGANGKSVLVETIARLLGGYGTTVRVESITGTNRRGGGEATPDLMPLMGARFVRTSEPDKGVKLQEGLIKELTGGEPLLIRDLHSKFLEYTPIFKLVMSGNHKPDIRGTDDGIWDRIFLVPFEERIPHKDRDLKFVDKLMLEADAIFHWAVEGLVDYLEGGLRPPEKVLAATKEYRAESDPCGSFLEACTIVTGDTDDRIWSAELTEAMRFWQMTNGTGTFQQNTIGKALSDKVDNWEHPGTGLKFSKVKSGGFIRYVGLKFTDVFGKQFKNYPRDHQGELLVRTDKTGSERVNLPPDDD